jgi:hypothetical protein
MENKEKDLRPRPGHWENLHLGERASYSMVPKDSFYTETPGVTF